MPKIRHSYFVDPYPTNNDLGEMYPPEGELVARQRFEIASDDPLGRCVDETFDGVDRPLGETMYDSSSERLDSYRFTYENDSRGNWFKRWIAAGDQPPAPMIWREIEYAN